ncbi:MAG: CsgG/HfaB family protein [Spirochaetaceae bacterium]|jgi:curli biogenesis system outer membrane secretion channel CsgG|nr:CsgG/HfaB family protein [Spirochaetaceae bacterium]
MTALALVLGVLSSCASSDAPAAVYQPSGVESGLERAANQVMNHIQPRSRIAIVYVTSRDRDVTEYITSELEYIMVNDGFTLIDRSQLDQIRKEQGFQMSGEVDDATAVSIGKIIGANVIITGAVTGSGDLRRLRLRALNTQTAQVMATA